MHNDLQQALNDMLVGQALAVDPSYWQSVRSELSLLSKGSVSGADVEQRKLASSPRLLDQRGQPVGSKSTANLNDVRTTPAGSVAHLQLSGLMLATDFLWYRGVNHLTAELMAAEGNPKITGVILEVNSGGGMSTAGEMLKSTMEGMRKPVVVLTHYMASAAVMATLPASAIVASSRGTRVGSIGTYIQLSKYDLQRNRDDYRTIYAKQSTHKNHDLRAAQDGNFEPLQKLVDAVNGLFVQDVKDYRPLRGDVAGTLSGAMFFANDAKQRGLVDGVGTFATALSILQAQVAKGKGTKRKTVQRAAPVTCKDSGKPWLNTERNKRLQAKFEGRTYVPEQPAGKPWLNNPINQRAAQRERSTKK